jgi:hypothetical protein
MTSFFAHSIRLPLILSHASVNSPAKSASFHGCSQLQSTHCTMSGRIGALKTLGKGWVSLLAEPSGDIIVTTGRLVILVVVHKLNDKVVMSTSRNSGRCQSRNVRALLGFSGFIFPIRMFHPPDASPPNTSLGQKQVNLTRVSCYNAAECLSPGK